MTIGLWQIILIVAILSIIIVPIWLSARIAGRAGFSGWWALLTIVPFVNVVIVWVFAFTKWPRLPQSDRPSVLQVP